MQGNDDACYYGLPSIERSDAAFKGLGYWRGYVWGPMAQVRHLIICSSVNCSEAYNLVVDGKSR